MNDKLLFISKEVEVYDYSEKSVLVVGKRANLFMQEIYQKKLCMPNLFKKDGKAGYIAAKRNLAQIESILDYNATAKEIIKVVEIIQQKTHNLPFLTELVIDLSDLDDNQLKPVLLVLNETNEYLAGTRELTDISWIGLASGPGSGKTHTLIKKILIEVILPAFLPKKPDLNILCTTFTKNGIKEIQKKFKKSNTPELIDYVEISTISSIGYRVLKEKYSNWKFDIESEKISLNDIVKRDFSKIGGDSVYMKNKHKTKIVMKYLDIETNYSFSIYKKIPIEDYERYQKIIQRSKSFLIESKGEFLEFLSDEGITEKRDVKILSLAYTKGFKEFDKAYKTVNNYYYERFYAIAVALAKNENVEYNDFIGLKEMLDRHKSDFIRFREDITDRMLENVLLILQTSDIFHTIPFENKFKKGATYFQYLFDYNDFARIPLLEGLMPDKKYDFFFIDEFQDLTDVQYKYLLFLANQQKTVLFGVGDLDQSIFYYGGTNHGKAFFDFLSNQKTKVFELTYNYRSSDMVCKDYVSKSYIDKKYKLRPNAPIGISKNIPIYEKALDLVDYTFAVICTTNAEIFDVVIDLIERNKIVYMREEEFNIKMEPIYQAIRNGKESTSGILNYYRTEIRNKENEIKEEFPNTYEELIEGNYELNLLKKYQKKIKSLLLKFGFIDSKENIKNESVFELLEKIKEFLKFENGEDIENCIQVVTIHECKGSEFENVLMVNLNRLSEEWRNQTSEEMLVNDKLTLVACSRAMIGNYYTETKSDKKNITTNFNFSEDE